MGVAERAKEEIPFIKGYAAVRFNGDVVSSFGEDTEKVIENLKNVVREYLDIYKKLGEYSVGMPKEILLSTTELFILVRIFYNEELFQVGILQSDANLGFTRYKFQEYLQELVK
jgi:predicted RNase H-like HicB family nuclease